MLSTISFKWWLDDDSDIISILILIGFDIINIFFKYIVCIISKLVFSVSVIILYFYNYNIF